MSKKKSAPKSRRAKPANPRRRNTKEELYTILEALAHAMAVIKTAQRSLEHDIAKWDEVVTLRAGLQMLRRVDQGLNNVADGRPSGLTLDDEEAAT